MMRYLLAAIAGIWLIDGLTLILFPLVVIRKLQETLVQTPRLLRWEAIGIWFGLILILFTSHLPYQPLWWTVGCVMVAKSWFLAWGPSNWRGLLLTWCFHREAVDYRFLGLWLCTLAVLLLHGLGWLGGAPPP
ncbi:MAG: hypothetical protein KF814_08655 [Nitrospiraceae bacterium]|nr:hypothetical protein [Nitrospiraceae bacterium]